MISIKSDKGDLECRGEGTFVELMADVTTIIFYLMGMIAEHAPEGAGDEFVQEIINQAMNAYLKGEK